MVKVIRGTRAAEYVQRIDRSPVATTLKRNQALVIGKLTAEDVVNSLGKFPLHPGTRTRPSYRVAPPRDHRMCGFSQHQHNWLRGGAGALLHRS